MKVHNLGAYCTIKIHLFVLRLIELFWDFILFLIPFGSKSQVMYHFIHKHFRIRLKKHKIIIASKKFNNSFKISHHFQSLNYFKNDHIYEKKLKIWTLTWELKLLRNDSHFVFDVTSYYGYYYFQLLLKSFIIYIIFRYIQKCVI